jgi:uncharacterized protein
MRWLARLKGTFSSRRRRRPPPGIDAGDVEAAYRQGVRLSARGRKRSALRPLRYAAEAGHAGAAYKLGRVLTGPRQEQERLAWLRRAPELARDQGQSATKVAGYHFGAGQRAQARDVLRQAAGDGDADAAYMLAQILETGLDTALSKRRPAEPAEAERYYLIACDLGHVGAHVRLGLMLAGAGRPEEAEPHFLVAAEQGSSVAARRLAEAAQRAGRDQDAERYLRIAAKDRTSRENALALAGFLSSKGRLQEAADLLHHGEEVTLASSLGAEGRISEVLPLLHKRAKGARPDELRAIAAVLRSAGLDKEAREYRSRADVQAGLDAIDKCLE